MIDPATFERARLLFVNAIEEAYRHEYLVPPIETSPGHWHFWPFRKISLRLEETRDWVYGVPKGGVGKLQARIKNPYASMTRVKASDGDSFGERQVKRIVRQVKTLTDKRTFRDGSEKALADQEVYIAGYEAVEDMSESDREGLWDYRRKIYQGSRPSPWRELHNLTREVLRIPRLLPKGVFDWVPEEEADSKWFKYGDILSPGQLYEAASAGFFDALDDWAAMKGYLVEDEEGYRVSAESKEPGH